MLIQAKAGEAEEVWLLEAGSNCHRYAVLSNGVGKNYIISVNTVTDIQITLVNSSL